jgi:hypothetical protein
MRTNQAARGCATHPHLRLISSCISIPGRASRPWRLTIHHVRETACHRSGEEGEGRGDGISDGNAQRHEATRSKLRRA